MFSVTAQTRLGWGKTAYALVFTTNNRERPQAPSVPQVSKSQIQSRQITFSWTPGRDGFAPLRYLSHIGIDFYLLNLLNILIPFFTPIDITQCNNRRIPDRFKSSLREWSLLWRLTQLTIWSLTRIISFAFRLRTTLVRQNGATNLLKYKLYLQVCKNKIIWDAEILKRKDLLEKLEREENRREWKLKFFSKFLNLCFFHFLLKFFININKNITFYSAIKRCHRSESCTNNNFQCRGSLEHDWRSVLERWLRNGWLSCCLSAGIGFPDASSSNAERRDSRN